MCPLVANVTLRTTCINPDALAQTTRHSANLSLILSLGKRYIEGKFASSNRLNMKINTHNFRITCFLIYLWLSFLFICTIRN